MSENNWYWSALALHVFKTLPPLRDVKPYPSRIFIRIKDDSYILRWMFWVFACVTAFKGSHSFGSFDEENSIFYLNFVFLLRCMRVWQKVASFERWRCSKVSKIIRFPSRTKKSNNDETQTREKKGKRNLLNTNRQSWLSLGCNARDNFICYDTHNCNDNSASSWTSFENL